MRNTRREFDDLDTALDIPLGVGDGLAVLGGQQCREGIHLVLHERQELHQHPGPLLRVEGGPHPLRLRRVRDDCIDLGLTRQRYPGLHLAGIRVEDIAEVARGPGDMLSAYVVSEFANHASPVLVVDAAHRAIYGHPIVGCPSKDSVIHPTTTTERTVCRPRSRRARSPWRCDRHHRKVSLTS